MRRSLGFTLIEILIVIAVIGVLAATALTLLNPLEQFAKARDSERKRTLRELANALERYLVKKGSYPDTAGAPGAWYSSETVDPPYLNGPLDNGDWIPGLLASKEIIKLPKDPKGGLSSGLGCAALRKRAYLYRSHDDGSGSCYKLLSFCAREGMPLDPIDPNDPFFDPIRIVKAWMVCAPLGSVCCSY